MATFFHAKGTLRVQLPQQSQRMRIIESYNTLVNKGYFDVAKRGNELYIGGLVETLIPQHTQSILEVGGATGLLMAQILQKHTSIEDITAIEISDAARVYCDRIEELLPS